MAQDVMMVMGTYDICGIAVAYFLASNYHWDVNFLRQHLLQLGL